MALTKCCLLIAVFICLQFVQGVENQRFEDLPSVKNLLSKAVAADRDYQTVTIEDLWIEDRVAHYEKTQTNNRPIIGVLSQPRNSSTDLTYIMAAYVKFVEEGGARVVPLLSDEPDEVTKRKLDKLNGVLLPGGDIALQYDDGSLTNYSLKVKFILDYVKEQNKDGVYPLYAVCQGFEQLSVIEAPYNDTLKAVEAHNYRLNLTFIDDPHSSRLYKNMPDDLIEALETKAIAMHTNELRVDPKTFESGDLKAYKVIATAVDRNGLNMVSSIEHKDYPIYAHQFHPEKNQFVWTPFLDIPHNKEAMDLVRYFAEFFVSEARKNSNRFESYEEERANLIQNFPVEVTKGDLQDIYIFRHYDEDYPAVDPNLSDKPNVVFVLGGPGSGKTSVSLNIKDHINYYHISTGNLLRDEVKKGGELADELLEYMSQGKLISSELMVRLLKKAIEGHSHVLIDGFPRNQENIDEWDKQIGDAVNIQFVLYLKLSEETMIERVLIRGKLSGRVDDNYETMQKRIAIFRNETMPVIERFQEDGRTCEVYPNKDFWQLVADSKACFNQF